MNVYITSCPGVGKTTLAATMRKAPWDEKFKQIGHILEEAGLGYHPSDDRMRWNIDTQVLEKMLPRSRGFIFLSMSTNFREVGKLDWDRKLALIIPWTEAKPRLETRLAEKKNTWPANKAEWEDTRRCHDRAEMMFHEAGFELVDGSGTVEDTLERIYSTLAPDTVGNVKPA